MMAQDKNETCKLPPTIEDLAKDYALPGLVQLFNDKVKDAELAIVQGLTIKELGLDDAECTIRFSYLPEYRHPSWHANKRKVGFSISLQHAGSGDRITDAVHCLSETMTDRFNHEGGGTVYKGIENMQFVIDNPPQKIMKAILNCKPIA